jgi:hypothetical protein
MTNVMGMLFIIEWRDFPSSIRKEVVCLRKSEELLLAVVRSWKDFKVKWSHVHVGTQKACVNKTPFFMEQ